MFRVSFPNSFRLSSTTYSILAQPFFLLLFLFLSTSSTDLLHINLLLFKAKLTHAIAAVFFIVFILLFKTFHLHHKMFSFTVIALASMAISSIESPNRIACFGYLFLFIFNYFTYFSIPYNLLKFVNPELLLKIYYISFFPVGIYAICQVIFSVKGIFLPGVTQYIFTLARGQGFAYEPSFYALYMTPFAMFYNAKFILQKPADRKISEIVWPNLLLLASTSTGCVFSYIFFIFSIGVFNLFNVFKKINLPVFKSICKFLLIFSVGFAILWCISQDLVMGGFLKLFYTKGSTHGTVTIRWEAIVDYWNIFLENPWVGLGLGAGPTHLLQKDSMGSVDLMDRSVLENRTPLNVTTEILAGLGLLGSLAFVFFFYVLIHSFRTSLKLDNLSAEEKTNLIAFAISLCVMFCTLQFSQSIMRPYMWIHIGLFMGYAAHLKQKYRALSAQSKAPLPALHAD